MMNPEIGKGGFRIAISLVAAALVMLPFLQPNSAEFVVTVMTLFVGIVFIIFIAIMARVFK